MSAALRFSPCISTERVIEQAPTRPTLADFAVGCSPNRKQRKNCEWPKTVGAGISPSASLSDHDTVAAATSVKSSRHAGLDFDGPASRYPKAASVPDHAGLHPCGFCPACHRRFLPSFMAASVRRRRWHAFRGPVGLGFRPSKQASLVSLRAVRASGNPPLTLPFGWAIGSRLRWVDLTPGKGSGEWPEACG